MEEPYQILLAIQLFKLYNTEDRSIDWILLNLNQTLTPHQTSFSILKSNKRKVGLNLLANRLSALNGKIRLDWLNCSLDSFKVKCKKLML